MAVYFGWYFIRLATWPVMPPPSYGVEAVP